MKIKTWDITGFGNSYEATCQKMLWNAVRFLRSGNKEISTKSFANVYGVVINEGKDGKAFDEAMMEGIEDATGAMHQCATAHATYIQNNGYAKWFDELEKARTNEMPYDFEYDKDFILV
jgi:hypothetical protein